MLPRAATGSASKACRCGTDAIAPAGQAGGRLDLVLREGPAPDALVEIKNTTLLEGERVLFPDAVSERGTKHLRELQAMVREGHRAALAFFVHRTDVESFDALPKEAQNYIRFIADQTGVPVRMVSVGPARHQCVMVED